MRKNQIAMEMLKMFFLWAGEYTNKWLARTDDAK